MNIETADSNTRFVLPLWLCWMLFVVYGSLVPLGFQAIPLTEALARFARMPLLDVGLWGRADWIANGVLYLPVGFLTAALLGGDSTGRRLTNSALALVFGWLLAVFVEFLQLYFPQRTVSLNDLLAEALGSALGVLLAWRGATWLSIVQKVWRGHWREVAAALVPGAVLVVLLISWFPFDVLLSGSELTGKADGVLWGWVVAPIFAQGSWSQRVAQLVAEFLVVTPLGAMWARSMLVRQPGGTGAVSLNAAFWLGACLGLTIELGQWFVASGVSQGLSVLTRCLGWMAGAWLWNRRGVWGLAQWQAGLHRGVWPLAALHAFVLVLLSGWGEGPWRGVAQALARVVEGEVHFVPFYYHYFTSEAGAMQSLPRVALMYAPVGVWCWALSYRPQRAVWIGALAAIVVEAGKLFPLATRPDPTNVWIAAAAAGLAALVLHRLSFQGAAPVARTSSPPEVPMVSTTRESPVPGRSLWWLLPVAGYAAFWLSRFPVYQPAVGLMLIAGAALVWWRPVLVFGLVAAALPSWDLSTLSGREYVDEFDMLLLVTVAVAWVRRSQSGAPAKDGWLNAALMVFTASALLSALIAWQPWNLAALQDPDTPLSPWYALRLLKGLFWALCLYLLARQQQANGQPVVQSFGVGLVVGLALVGSFIFWERAAFVGLLDTSSGYRVAGPVVPMRLGGAYLDAFLMAALPFALSGSLFARSHWLRIASAAVALAGVYAVAVTFTRTTYLAAAVVCVVVAAAAIKRGRHQPSRPILAGLMLVALTMVAYPIVTGPFASARMSGVRSDLVVRIDHYLKAIHMGRDSETALFLGHGLARFPAKTYWASVESGVPGKTMAVHRFLRRGASSELQLGPGSSHFLDQFVHLQPEESVGLALQARAFDSVGSLTIELCQKWLLSSANCVGKTFKLAKGSDGWQSLSASIDSGPVAGQPGWLSRPVRLSMYNSGRVRIDVRQVSLRNEQGEELLRNGDFSEGSDHWSYASDDHLAWHVKNMALAVWFDQGLVGLFALAGLIGLGLLRGARAAWSGDRTSLALTAALIGLLIVSVFDSITDEPRYLLLLICMAWMAALPAGRRSSL